MPAAAGPADVQVEVTHTTQHTATHIIVSRQGFGPLVTIAKSLVVSGEIKYEHAFSVPADIQLVTRLVLMGLLAHRLDDPGQPRATHHVSCTLTIDGKMYLRSSGQLTDAWRQTLAASVSGRGGTPHYPGCHEFIRCLFCNRAV